MQHIFDKHCFANYKSLLIESKAFVFFLQICCSCAYELTESFALVQKQL